MNFEWITPPFDIVRVAHAEFVVADLDASRHFYVDLLGLIETARTDDALYLRGYEERLHHSLVLRRGPEPLLDHLAFRVRRPEDLDLLAAHYSGLGCEQRFVEGVELGQGRALRVSDPLGFPLEFFYEMEHVETHLWKFHLYRGGKLARVDHCNLFVPDVPLAYEYYRQLGFRCSEYIASDPQDELLAAWFYRKPCVHDVAFTTGAGPRLHHYAFSAMDSAAVIWLCEILGGDGEYRIERGPGRHGVSNAFYVYLQDPDGHRIELFTGDYYTGDPDHQPLRWSTLDPRRRDFWATAIPDSWYEEGTRVSDLDGQPVELVSTQLDERLVAAE